MDDDKTLRRGVDVSSTTIREVNYVAELYRQSHLDRHDQKGKSEIPRPQLLGLSSRPTYCGLVKQPIYRVPYNPARLYISPAHFGHGPLSRYSHAIVKAIWRYSEERSQRWFVSNDCLRMRVLHVISRWALQELSIANVEPLSRSRLIRNIRKKREFANQLLRSNLFSPRWLKSQYSMRYVLTYVSHELTQAEKRVLEIVRNSSIARKLEAMTVQGILLIEFAVEYLNIVTRNGKKPRVNATIHHIRDYDQLAKYNAQLAYMLAADQWVMKLIPKRMSVTINKKTKNLKPYEFADLSNLDNYISEGQMVNVNKATLDMHNPDIFVIERYKSFKNHFSKKSSDSFLITRPKEKRALGDAAASNEPLRYAVLLCAFLSKFAECVTELKKIAAHLIEYGHSELSVVDKAKVLVDFLLQGKLAVRLALSSAETLNATTVQSLVKAVMQPASASQNNSVYDTIRSMLGATKGDAQHGTVINKASEYYVASQYAYRSLRDKANLVLDQVSTVLKEISLPVEGMHRELLVNVVELDEQASMNGSADNDSERDDNNEAAAASASLSK